LADAGGGAHRGWGLAVLDRASGDRPPPEGTGSAGGRVGRTMRFARAWVTAAASVAGPGEGRGPLGRAFDEVVGDHLLGEKTWERAESRLLQRAVERLAARQGRRPGDYDLLLAGDLLNQTVASAFAARELDVPFFGLYNACATFAEALALAAALCEAGLCRRVVAAVSSHHDAAERQYRFPTELGNQRPPTAQWTATGAVAVAVESEPGERPAARVAACTAGRVVDFHVRDPFQMGAAMAPAAADTLAAHLRDLGLEASAYDALYTGDLGRVGRPICESLLRDAGLALRLHDCGEELYDPRHQDVHAGGSGAACAALVCAARILPALRAGWGRACLCCTGSLHSTTTYQQGETIPAVAHAVSLEAAPAGAAGQAPGGAG
jgi:stage V sporulation protein AD